MLPRLFILGKFSTLQEPVQDPIELKPFRSPYSKKKKIEILDPFASQPGLVKMIETLRVGILLLQDSEDL